MSRGGDWDWRRGTRPHLPARLYPVARWLIPRYVRRHILAVGTRAVEAFRRVGTGSVPLVQCRPLFLPKVFRGGPIVLVNNALAWGGVERQVVNTLRGLERAVDRDIGLLCLRLGGGADYDFYLPALKGFRGFVRNVISHDEALDQLTRCLGAERLKRARATFSWMPADVQQEIVRFLADFAVVRPEVVHIWQDAASISAGYAAKLLGVPRILISSRNVNPTHFAYHRPYMRNAYRELAACPDVIMINNSRAGADDYSRWLGIDPSRFSVVRNGIDPKEFSRPSTIVTERFRKQLELPRGVPVVGSIFRFYEEKRPLLWIEAAGKVARRRPDCHFVIFGTGPMAEEMRQAAERLGFVDRLHLPGTIRETSVGLSLFDVFVLTSKFEGTPNVVLEASVLGVPVVVTDAGGTKEAVSVGRTGIVVNYPDATLIAEAILSILDNSEQWENVVATGPAFIEGRFGLERMIEETLALYELD